MDIDEAWESFIGIRKSSNKGYADTIAAALNDIKTDTSNLAKLTNKLLGEQGMMESAGGIDSPQSLAAQGAGEAGGMDMPAEDMTQDKGVLDDAMGMMDQRAGAGTPSMGGEMPPMEGGEDPGMMADMDETAPPMEGGLGGTGDEGMAPEGMDGLGAGAGAGGEGDLPQAGGNFSTDCVQFLERAKEELQRAAGEGDYFKARKLIEIVTALNKILESDGNPDTILKSDSAGEYQSASPITTKSIGKTDGEEEEEEDEFTKSDAGEYESAEPAPTGNVTSSEGERRGMATPKVNMISKNDFDATTGDEGMSEAPGAEGPTESVATSDSSPTTKACDDETEEVKKSVAPDRLPSFSEMLAYRKGQSDVDSYTAFSKSARKALQDEVDEHFETMGFTKARMPDYDEMDALSDEERGRPDFIDYDPQDGPAGAAGVPVGTFTMGRAGRTPGKRFINREATQMANEEGYDPMGPNADYSDFLAEASLENDPITIDYDDPADEFDAYMDEYTGGNPDAVPDGTKLFDNWAASKTPVHRAAKQNAAGLEEAKKKSEATGEEVSNKTPDRTESKETSGKPAKKLKKADDFSDADPDATLDEGQEPLSGTPYPYEKRMKGMQMDYEGMMNAKQRELDDLTRQNKGLRADIEGMTQHGSSDAIYPYEKRMKGMQMDYEGMMNAKQRELDDLTRQNKGLRADIEGMTRRDETYPAMKSATPQGSISDKIRLMREDRKSYETSVTESFRKSGM